ncbi:MAG: nitrous oxide reductase family maturation protein NosD [Caldilineaceae bacterium]
MKRLGFVLVLCMWVGGAVPISAEASNFDLAAALAAAAPGSVITVPAGVYIGPFQLDKPVTLEGVDWPVLDGGGVGDVVTITAPDVTLRGFVIRNSGASLDREHAGITGLAPHATIENNRLEDVLFGIYLKNAPESVVRNNLVLSKALDIGRRGDGIRLWYCAQSLVEGNTVRDSRDLIIWYADHSVIRNNVVEESRYGLHFMSNDDLVIEANVLRRNSVGIYLMYGNGFVLRNNLLYDNRGPSGYGIGLKDVDNVVAEGNRMVSNRVGLYVDIAPRASAVTVRFAQNLLAYNEIGVLLLPLVQHNLYAENVFQENHEQIAIGGSGALVGNAWSADGHGNYWSDYAGFDADANGIGDLPYRVQSLFEDLLQTYPELRLFQLSPATQALDLAAKAFPIFQPQPKMVDDFPLMAAPTLPPVPGLPTPPVASNLLAAVLLLALALTILFWGKRQMGWKDNQG